MIKNVKISFKIMGMVAILLMLMAISSGFGILKIAHIGKELKDIAEEDIPLTDAITGISINQLEQAAGFERALRFCGVMVDKDTAARELNNSEQLFEERSHEVREFSASALEIVHHAFDNAYTEMAQNEYKNINMLLDSVHPIIGILKVPICSTNSNKRFLL